ncbi:hypothetical protein [Psychrosphaera aestuarii]|uniref:hypothetical protein n=1 Tax=Psychrosphaera aestuarii TaxID=1266052 RepID=UPI001B33991E|nr:hypothetical protein [Psychrosphaera aestuarii]
MNTHNDNALKPLPVIQILTVSLRLPFENAATIFRLGWPYLIVALLLPVLATQMGNSAFNIVLLPFVIATSVLAGVACHRIFLCPQEEVKQLSTFRWASSEADFFVAGLKLIFALIVGLLLTVGLGSMIVNIFDTQLVPTEVYFGYNLAEWAGMLVFGYVFSRISFILPGAAVGRYFNFNTSWAATKPYALRLFFVISFLPILLATIVNRFTTTMMSDVSGNPLGLQLAISVLSIVGAVIELCILSKSFEWVTSQMPEEHQEPTTE